MHYKSFLYVTAVILLVALSACQRNETTTSPDLQNGWHNGESRHVLGYFKVSLDFARQEAYVQPVKRNEYHDLITDSFTITFDWGGAIAEPSTNGVILPMVFENTSELEQTFYDVRVFYIELQEGKNGPDKDPWCMLVRNPAGYAFVGYEGPDPEFEPFFWLWGNNPVNREFIFGHAETVVPSFFLPNPKNYPGAQEFREIIIKIDGFTLPDQHMEPQEAILINTAITPGGPVHSNSGILDFRLNVMFGEYGENHVGDAYLDLSSFHEDLTNPIPMQPIGTSPPFHEFQYILDCTDQNFRVADHIVTATADYNDDAGDPPDEKILAIDYKVQVIEDGYEIPSFVNSVRSLVGDPVSLPIESVHRLSLVSLGTNNFLLVSPGTACDDTYFPWNMEGTPETWEVRDHLWVFDALTLNLISDIDLGIDPPWYYVYDAVLTPTNSAVVFLHHFQEVDDPPFARLRIYDNIFDLQNFREHPAIPGDCHSMEVIGDYIFLVNPAKKQLRRYFDNGIEIVTPTKNVETITGEPYDVEVDSNDYLYILRGGDDNSPIVVYDWPEGDMQEAVYISEWDLKAANENLEIKVRAPHGLGIDSQDNVYITDRFTGRVFVFTSNGEMLLSFGDTGAIDGRFTAPSDVVILNDNQIYVSDIENRETDLFKLPPPPEGGDPRIGTATSSVQQFTIQ